MATDIQYLTKNNERLYLIRFIDNRTRLLLHFEFLPKKFSSLAANAFLNAIGKYSPPKTITNDNGGEFIGNCFQMVADTYNIEDFRTKPYTPQQNGKN